MSYNTVKRCHYNTLKDDVMSLKISFQMNLEVVDEF